MNILPKTTVEINLDGDSYKTYSWLWFSFRKRIHNFHVVDNTITFDKPPRKGEKVMVTYEYYE